MGQYLFRKRVHRDITTLLSTTMSAVGARQVAARHDSLPEPVVRYLDFAIKPNAPPTRTVRLEHGGTFRTSPTQGWMPIRGLEYFTAAVPGFVWSARIRSTPFLWIDACDRLLNRRGNMFVKLESVFTVANVSGAEIDQGSSLRWLAEAAWFPYAFVGDAIEWEALSIDTARVTLTMDGAPVAAILEFDAEGQMAAVHGERYRTIEGGGSVLTPWLGRYSEYRDFGGFRVPAHAEVAWVIDGVEFAYARFDVTTIEYNVAA